MKIEWKKRSFQLWRGTVDGVLRFEIVHRYAVKGGVNVARDTYGKQRNLCADPLFMIIAVSLPCECCGETKHEKLGTYDSMDEAQGQARWLLTGQEEAR